MKRTPEPELMEAENQVKAYSQADFSRSDTNFVDKLAEIVSECGLSICDETLIIDLGCGPGNITEKLSLKWPSARVIGVEGSLHMVKEAQRRKEKLGLRHFVKNLNYLRCQISNLKTQGAIFPNSADLIVSNSFLHHIHDPTEFWEITKYLGKKDSLVFHRDLRRPKSFDYAISLQNKYQKNAPMVLKKDYLASLKAAFTISEVKEQIKAAQLDKIEVYEFDDRYLEIFGSL